MRRWLITAFWVSFVATSAIYAVMVLWSLPKISAAAGGLASFDMRPAGYSLDEATIFLTTLTDEGRAFYLSTQQWLDSFYPPMMAATLVLGLWIMAPLQNLTAKWVLAMIPILAMLADFLENDQVRILLVDAPWYIDPPVVGWASFATVIKSLLTTLAMTLLLFFTVLWGWRKWRRN